MNLPPKVLCLLALPACLAALAWGASRATAANRELGVAQSQHKSILAAANEIEHLRTSAPAIAASAKPQPNISGHVTDVLVEAGLTPALLTNLTPESDTAIASLGTGTQRDSARYRRQSARLTLEPTTLPDLGRFLKAWGNSQPQWTVASVTISPAAQMVQQSRGSNPPRPTSDASDDPDLASPNRPIRVNLVIECLYVDQVQPEADASTDSMPPPRTARP